MVGKPKACVANYFRPRVKTSLWPICKWILAPTLTSKDANEHHILPVGPGGSTLIKKNTN